MTVALRPPREPLDPRMRTWWQVHCVLGPLVPAVVLLVLGLLVAPVSWFVPVAVALVVAGLVVAAVFPAFAGLDVERAAELAERLTRATQAVPGDAT